jgi:hypothetical protein
MDRKMALLCIHGVYQQRGFTSEIEILTPFWSGPQSFIDAYYCYEQAWIARGWTLERVSGGWAALQTLSPLTSARYFNRGCAMPKVDGLI